MKVQLMQEKPSVSLKLLSKVDDNGAVKSKNFSYYFFSIKEGLIIPFSVCQKPFSSF
jgi:hypothetical protein